MNYQEILNRFTYDDETEIMDRISKADRMNYRENKDIINQIVFEIYYRLLSISAGKMSGDSVCKD